MSDGKLETAETTDGPAVARAIWASLHPALSAAILIPSFLLHERAPLLLAATAGLVAIAAIIVIRRVQGLPDDRGATAVALASASGLCWAIFPATLYASAHAFEHPLLLAATIAAPAAALLMGSGLAVRAAFVVPAMAGGFCGFLAADEVEAPLLVLMLLGVGTLVLFARPNPAGTKARHGDIASPGRRIQDEFADLLLRTRAGGADDWLWEIDDRLHLGGDLQRLADTTGLSRDWLVALPLSRMLVEGALGTEPFLSAVAAHEPLQDHVIELRLPGGGTAWWRLTGAAIHDGSGRFCGYRGLGTDITALREAQARIAHLATHDALTGLANRTTFQTLAGRACAAAAAGGAPQALLLLDLDGFKQVNDDFGHGVGDELLAAVAATLERCAPVGAVVARLGGDEFAILHATSAAGAEVVAAGIARAIAAPFALGAHEAKIGVSIGIALAPLHATSVGDLVSKADLALYRAKDSADRRVLFQEGFALEIAERLRLEADIRLALERGEFRMHYQPLLDPLEGRVVACEALMRWRSPVRGDVPPSTFIPAAERGNLIVAIGRLALEQACRDAATWPVPAAVAVNVSPQHLRSADFKADVLRALKLGGLAPSRLEVEVTEGVFLDKSPASVEAMTWLHERGIKVALDDFGTGFSSLSYLLDFPVDKIKIDRAFVTDLLTSPKSQAVVDAILTLARRLGIRVVAEGVETVEQALALKLRRCDDLQGYLISRPQPPEEIARLLVALPGLVRAKVPALLDSSFAAALVMKGSAKAG